jgi:hypothetical protein
MKIKPTQNPSKAHRRLFLKFAAFLGLSNLLIIPFKSHAGGFLSFAFFKKRFNSIYTFTSHTFTTANTMGPSGPTLSALQSAYSSASWAQNTANFNVTNGIQSWTVPATGNYRVTLAGASAVRQYYSGTGLGSYYGRGALFTTDLNLTSGEVIKILVGQLPLWNGPVTTTDALPTQQNSSYNCFNGGGGGTFVVRSNGNVLLAAAGGGGSQRTNYTCVQSSMDAKTDFTATGNNGGAGTGGSNGSGGTRGSPSDQGCSGAGFSGDGNASEGASTAYYTFAKSFLNGGSGATSTISSNNPVPSGGFGGGGAGGWGGSGGGGGYSGGGGGTNDSAAGFGGGGANYSIGSNTSAVSLQTGQGYVTILKL